MRSRRPGSEVLKGLSAAIRERDLVSPRVAFEPGGTWQESIRGRVRALGLDIVIAHDGANDCRLGCGRARMQRAAVTLGARAVEHRFPLLLELVQLGVRIRERRSGEDRLRQPPHLS